MSEFSHNLAVVVGINRYGNGIAPLRTAVNDVKVIARQLRQDHHYQVLQIIDQQATLASLQQLLTTVLPQQVQPGSRLLFYFAGHGIALNGDSGPEGYLIPQDAIAADTQSYLSMGTLQAALTKLPCRHFLGILDCCFAGAFRWSSTRDIGHIPEVIHKERYDRFIQDPAWQLITSAAYDQKALDALTINSSRGQIDRHSPFAAALLEALSGKADIYPPAKDSLPAGDGVITATELYLYLRERVEPATEDRRRRQTPGIWPLEKHDKGEYIFLSPGHRLNLPPAPKLDVSQNPYLGLAAFDAAQSDLFFGREALTERLVGVVGQQPLTVVLGPSGSGKSSLVKAGLMPRLSSAGAVAKQWYSLPPVRLDRSPVTSLWQVLGLNQSENFEPIADSLTRWCQRHPRQKCLLVIDQFESLITLGVDREEKDRFLAGLQAAIAACPSQLRLVVTLRSDFEPLFQESALQPHWNKSRFVVPPMTRLELREAIVQPASKRVIYFQSDNLQYPLVDQIIDEVADMPGALPLLSFTLSELYLKYLKRQEIASARGDLIERTMSEADYRELGGVARSLTQRADSEYDALVARDPKYAATVRNVMLRMVAVGRSQLARRSVPFSELAYSASEQQRVQIVIEQFSAARLLVEGKTPDGQPYVEPAHDALVLGWQKLLRWKQAEEARLILQRRLAPAAEEWRSLRSQATVQAKAEPVINAIDRTFYAVEHRLNQLGRYFWERLRQRVERYFGQPGGSDEHPALTPRAETSSRQFLWSTSPYLDIFKEELAAEDNSLNQLERTFVRESVLLKRRTASWRWRVAIAVILALSGLLLAALVARRADLVSQVRMLRNSAEVNARAGQQLDALSDSLKAAQTLKRPLLRLFRPNAQLSDQVAGTLQKTVYGAKELNRFAAGQGVTRSSLSPDGRLIVSAGEDGSLILWDRQQDQFSKEKLRWTTGHSTVLSVGFSPDGEKVVTTGVEGAVRLWNLQGKLLADFKGHTDAVQELSFSPDGGLLATASRDRTLRLWDIQEIDSSTQPVAVLRGHEAGVWSVAFSPDGRQIASASDDGTFRLWTRQGRLLQQVQAQQGELHVVKFSPDGQRLATAGQNGQLRLWTRQGDLVATLLGHQGRVWGLSFSQASASADLQLASASGDGSVRLWSAQGEPLSVLQSHEGPVRDVSFAPDGQRLVSSGDDGTLRLWNFQRQHTMLNELMNRVLTSGLDGPMDSIRMMALSPLGKIVTSTGSADVGIWTRQGELIARWRESDTVRAIALSADGEKVAIAQDNKLLLRTAEGQLLAEQSLPFQDAASSVVKHFQISADGTRVILTQGSSRRSAQDGDLVHLWTLDTQELVSWRSDAADITAAAISPSGDQIATAGEEGGIYLWNAQGDSLGQLVGHLGAVRSIAFSPEADQLASGGEDGTVRLWPLDDSGRDSRAQEQDDLEMTQERTIFQVYTAEVNAVSFSEEGDFLSSADSEGNVQLWNLKTQEPFSTWSDHPGVAIRDINMRAQGLTTLAEGGTAYQWPMEDLPALRAQGCRLIRDFVEQQAIEARTPETRTLCTDIPMAP
ncbi:MAG: caspase family protein [Phormidesmis sp.]